MRNYNSQEYAYAIRPISGGGYAMIGQAEGNGGSDDVWFLKINASGTATNTHRIGSTSGEYAWTLDPAPDGGYFVSGVVGNAGDGTTDGLVMKLNSTGSPVWQKHIGGAGHDRFRDGRATSDGGFVAVGSTSSTGAGAYDIWVVKFDSMGAVRWQKTYGGTGSDEGNAVDQTSDSGYIVAVADSAGAVPESNESNNRIAIPLP